MNTGNKLNGSGGIKVRTCCCFCQKCTVVSEGASGIADFTGCSKGNAIGFSHAYNVAKCSQNEMRARGQGNRDVQSQFTFANTWSLIGSHSGDANLFFC